MLAGLINAITQKSNAAGESFKCTMYSINMQLPKCLPYNQSK